MSLSGGQSASVSNRASNTLPRVQWDREEADIATTDQRRDVLNRLAAELISIRANGPQARVKEGTFWSASRFARSRATIWRFRCGEWQLDCLQLRASLWPCLRMHRDSAMWFTGVGTSPQRPRTFSQTTRTRQDPTRTRQDIDMADHSWGFGPRIQMQADIQTIVRRAFLVRSIKPKPVHWLGTIGTRDL